MIKGQYSLFDYIKEYPEEKQPPEFKNKDILKNIKGLSEIINKLPKYLVTFKRPVFGGYKRKICIFIGYWHSLDGWNYDNKNIIDWNEITYKNGDKYRWKEEES